MEMLLGADILDPDQETIEQIRQGEAAAFEELVRRYHRRVYALTYRFVRNEAEAADLTQEIFLRVWQKIDSFRGDAKFSTWLFQIAGNHCKNRLKYLKRRHHAMHDSLEAGFKGDDSQGPAVQIADESADPHEQMAGARMQQLVREKLEELPEAQRDLLLMRDIDDLDYAEIAEATGLPLGTVKSRIHRGRAELARSLKLALDADEV